MKAHTVMLMRHVSDDVILNYPSIGKVNQAILQTLWLRDQGVLQKHCGYVIVLLM